MAANPLEVQTQIMHNSNAIRDSIKDLYEWEKDIKQKEKQRLSESEVN